MTELEILLKEHEWLCRRIEWLNQTGQVINISATLVFSVGVVLSSTADDGVRIAVAVVLPFLWSGLLLYSQVLRWDTAKYREYVRALELRINDCANASVAGWEVVTAEPEEKPYAFRYFLWYWLIISSVVWVTSVGYLWLVAFRIPLVFWFASLQTLAAVLFGLGMVRVMRWRDTSRLEARRRSLGFFKIADSMPRGVESDTGILVSDKPSR